MRLCACGNPVDTKYGRFCPDCRLIALSNAGKISTTKLNYAKREAMKQAERRTQEKPVVTMAKCPACPDGRDRHMVMLPPSMVEKGKIPRIFCGIHEGNRSRTITDYGTGARV